MNKASLKRLQDIEDTILQLVVQRKKLRLSLSVEFLHHLRVLTKDPELICVYNPNKTLFMGRSDGSLYLEVPRDHETTNKREEMKKLIGKLLLIKPKGHQKRWKFK
jgi:hypothetical protein